MSGRAVPNAFEHCVSIKAPAPHVWRCLTDIESMKAWVGEPAMAIEVETNWEVGKPIVISGFHHASFKNTGRVLAFEPSRRLAYTHLSSLSRLADKPENHTTLEFILDAQDGATNLALRASCFPTYSIFKHLEFYWRGTLEILRQQAERH